MRERKRESGYRLEVILPGWAREVLQRAATGVDLEIAAYARAAILRHVAQDLVALGPILPGPGPGSGYQRPGPETGPGPGERYRLPGSGTGPGTGPPPGTAVALSGCSGASDAQDAAACSGAAAAAGEPVPEEEELDEEDRAMLAEAIEWRVKEIAATKPVSSPSALRATLRKAFLADPSEVDAVLERKDAASEPKGRQPGRDRT